LAPCLFSPFPHALPPSFLPPSSPQVTPLLCHVLEVSAEGAKEAVKTLHCHTAGRDVTREGEREGGREGKASRGGKQGGMEKEEVGKEEGKE